uniref:Uncharacterized protein n=1 Tax=Parascaris univalens TaxID=6257 RepID=A0A915C3U5_PARUN
MQTLIDALLLSGKALKEDERKSSKTRLSERKHTARGIAMNSETIKYERGSEASKASDLFVRIGDSELRGNLPVEGPFNAKLYKEVEEKQKLLARLKEKNEKVLQQKAETELQFEAQTDERNFIKSLKESNECQLQQERHLIKIAEIEKARLLGHLTEIQQRLQEKQERHKALTIIYENQKQLYDHLVQSDEAQQQLRKNFNDRISGTEKSCFEIRKALENDNKIAMELEAYLKKLTKQIFDKQRELEKFKLGELDATARIILSSHVDMTNSKHFLRHTIERMRHRKKQPMNNFTERDYPTCSSEEMDFACIVFYKLSKLEVQLAGTSAKEKVGQARNKRYETKIEISKLEPDQPMYKVYEASTSSKSPQEKKKENDIRSEIMKKRLRELDEARTSNQQAEMAIANLRKRLQELRKVEDAHNNPRELIQNDAINESEQQEDSAIDIRDPIKSFPIEVNHRASNEMCSESMAEMREARKISQHKKASTTNTKPPDNNDEHVASKGFEKANARRDKILSEQISDAELRLKEEQRQVKSDVAVLTTKANAIEAANERLSTELKKLIQQEVSLRDKITHVEAVIKTKEEEGALIATKTLQEKDSEKRMRETKLDVLIKQGEQLKKKQNEMKVELKNNQIMINNYRNRYNTLSQMRKNAHGDEKEVTSLVASLDEWRTRVNDSEKELQSLEMILMTANQKNQIVKSDLATMKPYSEEATELKRIYARKKALQLELIDAKNKLRILQMEKNRETAFDNDDN